VNIRGAKKEAQKRWGDNYAIADRIRPSREPARNLAFAKLTELRAITQKSRTKEQREEMNALLGQALYYRFRVGYVHGGFCFSVQGEGDTWEEAFAQADKRK
jgi:hypothetical protein